MTSAISYSQSYILLDGEKLALQYGRTFLTQFISEFVPSVKQLSERLKFILAYFEKYFSTYVPEEEEGGLLTHLINSLDHLDEEYIEFFKQKSRDPRDKSSEKTGDLVTIRLGL